MTGSSNFSNASGLPAITMPVAASPLPMGVQAIGRPGAELALLRFSVALERELGWWERHPPCW